MPLRVGGLQLRGANGLGYGFLSNGPRVRFPTPSPVAPLFAFVNPHLAIIDCPPLEGLVTGEAGHYAWTRVRSVGRPAEYNTRKGNKRGAQPRVRA